MTDPRPAILPSVVAQAIETAPDRVRRRLDRTPQAAGDWNWQLVSEVWKIDTGGETVTLPGQTIQNLDAISCTCLLSPNCFHILACLTTLEVTVSTADTAEDSPAVSPQADEAGPNDDTVHPSDTQCKAAAEMRENLARLLRVGAANAGVVVQSGLLRAVHTCRAEGLHRAAAIGLRVLTGVSQYRSRDVQSDPAELAEDVADLLETTLRIGRETAVADFWIGTARRKQHPVRPRKLHGLLAEPIVTRSGYSGAAAYFLGEDDQIYTASDVKPGEPRLAHEAYRGGIEIGPLVQPAQQLARGLYLGTNLTASRDGRLGRGKGVKLVQQGLSSWQSEAVAHRFQRNLSEQRSQIYGQASLPAEARPAGWDFVFLAGHVLGAAGPELLWQDQQDPHPVRLAIPQESEDLYFRENLKRLSHLPGLPLYLIGRLDLTDPTIVYPLAISPQAEGEEKPEEGGRLDLPLAWGGRVCLGFDRLLENHMPGSRAVPLVLGEGFHFLPDDPLAALRRNWIAVLIAGVSSLDQGGGTRQAGEIARLVAAGFPTAASLLDALSQRCGGAQSPVTDHFLATALYLRNCHFQLAQSRVDSEFAEGG